MLHVPSPSLFFQYIRDFRKVLLGLLKTGQHTVAMHHFGPSKGGIGNPRTLASRFKIRQSAVEHLVRGIKEVDIPRAGKIPREPEII